MSDNEQQQEAPANDGKVSLKVAYTTGGNEDEIQFSVKPTTKLGKIFTAFCQRTGQDINTVRFTFNGERLREEETVKQHEMEDDDIIQAHVAQIGGRC